MSAEVSPIEDSQNRTVTGQTNASATTTRLAKTHQDYWRAKLKRRSYAGRDGTRIQIPEWQVRMFHLGREGWFNTNTANQAAAAIKARDIYLSLLSRGWEATTATYKPDPLAKAEFCSVGAFLADVEERSHFRPRTARIYATKLRKLVSDVAKLEVGMKKKAKRAKFDYHHGGRNAWLALVDSQSLGVLTPEKVTAWRNT